MSNKIVLDNKRRGSFGSNFHPGDSFAREISGDTVIFRKLQPLEAPLVRARKVKGRWIGAKVNLSRDAILHAIRDDRDSR